MIYSLHVKDYMVDLQEVFRKKFLKEKYRIEKERK